MARTLINHVFEVINILLKIITFNYYKKKLFHSVVQISFFSLPVVFLTSFFTGAVLTMQASAGLSFLAGPETLSKIVVSAIVRELGPVLTGLMISGRIASALAAEISTMKVSDQIEALKTLRINPVKFLVVPKIVASLISMPILITVSNFIAFFGSWTVATFHLKYNSVLYTYTMFTHLKLFDFNIGVMKSVMFGFIITYIGTSFGLNSDGSSSGVGKSTTRAVVVSSILILVCNYVITYSFF
ncbi:MAG: phospholipid/cholesterol/gamma-HCH transport system permease protein [Candidatus Deianiraeaceae bacterium]|jgi:phospholipid/cholesterol/gamma-HCH transport system permease protein